jgi:YegS/Rv2252/BmrU family lipid kinase
MKKLLFIFNPAAGRGKIKSKLFDIVDAFVKYGYRVHMYPTQQKGDATAFLMVDTEPYDLLVCAGGDGTLNEVVTGQMLSGKSVPIGYIPAGSMNDVGHSFKISRNIMSAVSNILTGKPFALDIGKFNDKYFVYVAAFGAFTDIPYTTSQKNKNMIGNLSYYLEGIKKLSELKDKHVKIQYEDKVIEDKFIVGLITNSLYIGGFKNVNNEKTSLNDGLLEMLLIKMPKNIYDLQTIITSLISNKMNPNFMYYIQAPKLTITSESMEWTLDGEYGGAHKNVTIEACSKAINIVCDTSVHCKEPKDKKKKAV